MLISTDNENNVKYISISHEDFNNRWQTRKISILTKHHLTYVSKPQDWEDDFSEPRHDLHLWYIRNGNVDLQSSLGPQRCTSTLWERSEVQSQAIFQAQPRWGWAVVMLMQGTESYFLQRFIYWVTKSLSVISEHLQHISYGLFYFPSLFTLYSHTIFLLDSVYIILWISPLSHLPLISYGVQKQSKKCLHWIIKHIILHMLWDYLKWLGYALLKNKKSYDAWWHWPVQCQHRKHVCQHLGSDQPPRSGTWGQPGRNAAMTQGLGILQKEGKVEWKLNEANDSLFSTAMKG